MFSILLVLAVIGIPMIAGIIVLVVVLSTRKKDEAPDE